LNKVRLSSCAVCGEADATKLEDHHFIPRLLGGSDHHRNMLTLCGACHAVLHGMQSERRLEHRSLTRSGLTAAKARGTVLGRHGREVLAPRNGAAANDRAQQLAETVGALKSESNGVREIAAALKARGVPYTARRSVARYQRPAALEAVGVERGLRNDSPGTVRLLARRAVCHDGAPFEFDALLKFATISGYGALRRHIVSRRRSLSNR
jgi:HNH endonuclease